LVADLPPGDGEGLERRDEAVLRTIESDHEDAVTRLRQAVQTDGEAPDTSSGPWGTWAKVVTGAAKLVSESAVLKVLKVGEEHGLKEYEEALGDEDDIDAFSREIIRDTLVPRQRAHIAAIDRCMRTLH